MKMVLLYEEECVFGFSYVDDEEMLVITTKKEEKKKISSYYRIANQGGTFDSISG